MRSLTCGNFLYYDQGRYDEAEPLCVKVLNLRRQLLGDEHPLTLRSVSNLAVLHTAQGRHGEAESLLIQATEAEEAVGIIEALVDLYGAWNKPDKAAEWRAKLPPEEETGVSNETPIED